MTVASTFKRWIAVDWSDGGTEISRASGLAVAVCSRQSAEPEYPDHQPRNRREMAEWLTEKLAPTEPSTLIGLDFGFGYPAPAALRVFGASRWEELALLLAKKLEQESAKARDVAESINKRFGNAFPFRINASRSDPRFYLQEGCRISD